MIRPTATGVRLTIRLAPKASRDQVQGPHGDALKIAITAPPVEGKANAHLIKFLAKRLGVAKGAVTIASGELSRDKVVDVAGITEADARARLLGG
ncbi:MAG: YggU family protein [Nitrospirae bacterium]|nr:YggU family protein [Nitrospirota bacterium]